MYVSPLYFRNDEKQISIVILALTDLTSVNMDWTDDENLTSGPSEYGFESSTFYPSLDISIQKFIFHGVDAPSKAQKLIQKYYCEVDLDCSYADQISFARAFK
jgi:hypothetical protein